MGTVPQISLTRKGDTPLERQRTRQHAMAKERRSDSKRPSAGYAFWEWCSENVTGVTVLDYAEKQNGTHKNRVLYIFPLKPLYGAKKPGHILLRYKWRLSLRRNLGAKRDRARLFIYNERYYWTDKAGTGKKSDPTLIRGRKEGRGDYWREGITDAKLPRHRQRDSHIKNPGGRNPEATRPVCRHRPLIFWKRQPILTIPVLIPLLFLLLFQYLYLDSQQFRKFYIL